MNNKPKKNKLSLKVLVFLFLGSLAYAVYDYFKPFKVQEGVVVAKTSTPEYFDYGSVTDSIYCNDFFKFRIPILKGHEAQYKQYDYIEKTIYERDSVPAQPLLASEVNDNDLLFVIPELEKIDIVKSYKEEGSFEKWQSYQSEKSKRERFGADYQLIIRVHNLSGSSMHGYLNQFGNLHNPNYGSPNTKEISGVFFKELHGVENNGDGSPGKVMFQMLGGKNKNIITYSTEIKGFAVSIELFYLNEEQKDVLLEMVDGIHFH
ncbi:hypothetical protein FEE95_17725 [Maribacter algarum]|uniref:Uncharacterized protein n=1 Tax=Maribacter algarum (ex Zhang et al. 2020) TaxID=2578118 RepID=A0A5S3PHK0_9FLAO|nr:hypothetical protein [Maribacter algarum]TMM53738.1 hypothetical protein FEE95_17725 [Maribacter algarum]